MFTGIIEEIGTVLETGPRPRIRAPRLAPELKEGDSVAVSGVCLTAVDLRADSFAADVSPETASRTTLEALRTGLKVNLERALTPTSRLGGHIVQGHVDGAAHVVSIDPLRDGNWRLRVEIPPELDRYIVFKGSLTLDGISLTVAELSGHIATVAVIPHTFQSTTLALRRPGDALNLEVDVLARYVEKLLHTRPASQPLTVASLMDQGF